MDVPCALRLQEEQGKRCAANRELTQIHEEVPQLGSIHGHATDDRSIQAEGVFGIIKWDRCYKRAFRRGMESVILEFMLIFCGFNLYKYHNKKLSAVKAA